MEGGRSCVNDGEQRGRGGGGETILVRGLKSVGNVHDEKSKHYRLLDFHKVDLKEGGKVEKNCYPDLLTWKGEGVLLRAGPKLYIIGGMTDLGLPAADKNYTCGFVLDMKEKEEEEEEESCTRIWKQFPVPIFYRYSTPCCASLDGKIYHFEFPSSLASEAASDPTSVFSRLYPEVYDPSRSLGFWEFIWCPPELPQFSLSGAVVPDPANNRILLNQEDNLYAYCPRDRTMTLVSADVYPWTEVVVLVDDVAYVHSHESSKILNAFDLSHGAKSLEVVWTSTVLTDTVNGVSYDVNLASHDFDALFHVGNSNFWFALWSPDYHRNTKLYFIKFKACRIGDQINCTPLALRYHLLESTRRVYDFLLLEEEACG